MKKSYFLLLVLCLFTGVRAQIITIPDVAFKTRLLEAAPTQGIAKDAGGNNITIDTNHNGEIEVSETANVVSLFVFHMPDMHDLTGVGSFGNLKNLYCYNLALSTVDVTSLPNLVELELTFCDLQQVNVTGLTNLKKLLLNKNQLQTLNVSGLTHLERLGCDNNQLSSLNVSQLYNLKYLHCYNNHLTSLGFNGLNYLNEVLCGNNQLTNLNLSGLPNLRSLSCGSNQLSNLNTASLQNLDYLYCWDNHISSLNVTGSGNLKYLYCHSNELTELNVSGLSHLIELYCSNNQLTNLDVNQMGSLTTLVCDSNNLHTISFKDTGYNGGVNDVFTFSGNAGLALICTNESKVSMVQNIVNQYNYVNCAVNSSCTLSTEDFDFNPVVKVYPNPVYDVLNLSAKDDTMEVTSVAVYNTLGQLVLTVPNASNARAVDVSAIARGNYFIKINSDKGVATVKFIKS